MPKFKITKPRYINGEYVFASPQHPAVIDLPKAPDKSRTNEWLGLHPIDETIEPPKPHYVKTEQRQKETAAGKFSERTSDREAI